MVKVIVGTQWGDEGKGRVIQILAKNADVVARYQGGANAGHTILINGKKIVFHVLPSGLIYQNTICVIGNGTAIDPIELVNEINTVKKWNINLNNRFFISLNAHIVMPYHKLKDDTNDSIGTTKRGIGPCYEDKYGRRGIHIGELLKPEIFSSKLKANLKTFHYRISKKSKDKLVPTEFPNFSTIYEQYKKAGEFLASYIADTSLYINKWIDEGKNIILEGAQGLLLDIDHGTYPYVTSSSPHAGGACIGLGIGPTKINEVIGVTKAYSTRVGKGPFATRMPTELEDRIRKSGQEYGATTGRPRNCGWLDAVLLKKAIMINGIKKIVLTKLDALDELPEIKICKEYKVNSTTNQIEPIYETMKGWQIPINNVRKYENLPPQAKKYVERITELLNVEIYIICVGPNEDETIYR